MNSDAKTSPPVGPQNPDKKLKKLPASFTDFTFESFMGAKLDAMSESDLRSFVESINARKVAQTAKAAKSKESRKITGTVKETRAELCLEGLM